MAPTTDLGTFRKLSDFEKKLFYKRQVLDLKKELAQKNFKLGEMQSEIDELKDDLVKIKSKKRESFLNYDKAIKNNKLKIKSLQSDLNRYVKSYGRLS